MTSSQPIKTPFARLRSRGELPHLYVEGGTYFVTFRLFDAILPPALHNSDSETVSEPGDTDAPDRLLVAYDPPLTLGSCLLRKHACAEVVQNALRYFDGERYELLAWCVMPNHVHACVTPLNGRDLDEILHSWKSFTAHVINKLEKRSGTLWERESFDHLVRSVRSLERFIQYIEANPVTAGLCERTDAWPFSSANRILV